MPPVIPSTGLAITNPLVLYRSLLATKRIEPDPAQHRLALHLQKLYLRLKDYQPEVDFSHRIDQLNRLVKKPSNVSENAANGTEGDAPKQRNSIFGSLQEHKEKTEATALTRRLTDHESAMQVQSPQGLMLYGEVGTGKSLLVDLLADCLPNKKKRRWHFNTFMLETFSRLEQLRQSRMDTGRGKSNEATESEEHSLLWLARDMISTSPILFLDEFQLPDRAASKILSNLLTSFFHLGGVLIATSNRMPEELANAQGMEVTPPPPPRIGLLGNRWGLLGNGRQHGRIETIFSGKGDFAVFLDVLRARCEVWDMEGGKDWRRREAEGEVIGDEVEDADMEQVEEHFQGLEPMAVGNWGLGHEQSGHTQQQEDKASSENAPKPKVAVPKHYFVKTSADTDSEALAELDQRWKANESRSIGGTIDPVSSNPDAEIPWQTTTLSVYARPLLVPRHYHGATKWTFAELCSTNLGSADYITLASTFHTFILTEVPVLTLLEKNEARRLITLLDALYEARCKLLVSAEAGPDHIFFPETKSPAQGGADSAVDGVYSETFAEIYQDSTSPFRPNISSYHEDNSATSSSASAPNYAPTTASPFSSTRSILADEDSDFGPVLGRHAGPSSSPRGPSDGAPGAGNEIGAKGPDFTKAGAYTGEDERFAYKRARSRLWEMCGSRWWAREEKGWWRPLSKESRRWEGSNATDQVKVAAATAAVAELVEREAADTGAKVRDEGLFRHNASPFRTAQEPPPKFSFVHAWGMMQWGKKAGAWGKGVEGLNEREKSEGDEKGEGKEKKG